MHSDLFPSRGIGTFHSNLNREMLTVASHMSVEMFCGERPKPQSSMLKRR